MEENIKNNISKIVKEALESELSKRKIDLKYLDNEQIEKLVEDVIASIKTVTDKKIKNVLLTIEKMSKKERSTVANKDNDRISRETRKEVKDRLLRGETIEEIKQLGVDITDENLEKLYKQYEDLISLSQGMPVAELVKRKINRESFDSETRYEEAKKKCSAKYYTYIQVNELSEIIKSKKQEIQSRLLAGESLEQIVADRELNICKEAVESIQEKINKNISKINKELAKKERSTVASKDSNIISRETRKEVKNRLLRGETIGEIKQLGLNITDENLEKLYKQCEDLILLSQGMPVAELVKRKINRELFDSEAKYQEAKKKCSTKYYTYIHINGLSEIIKSKKREIQSRLSAGESLEQIVADRELNVCKEAVESIQEKINKYISKKERSKVASKDSNRISRETRKEVKNRLLRGETIEEIKQLGLDITDENLEKLYKQYEDLILLSQGMPVAKLVKRKINRELFDSEEKYSLKCYNCIKSNALSEIIKGKNEQIQSRLLAGKSLEQIVSDRELNVCKEAVESVQEKINKELAQKGRNGNIRANNKSKKEESKVDDIDINNEEQKTVHIIKQMQQNYRRLYNRMQSNTEENDELTEKEIKIINRKIQILENSSKLSKAQQKNLATLIDKKSSTLSDLEELKKLAGKLSFKMRKECYFASVVYDRIENKIRRLEDKMQITENANTTFPMVDTICKQLSDGTLDIEIAEKVINEEAKNQIRNGSKSKFALTEEQVRRKVIVQIKQNLVKNATNYIIENPQATISSLSKLTGEDEKDIFEVIVNNLIENKQFDCAKEICYDYNKSAAKEGNDILLKKTSALARKAKNYELGNIILRALKLDAQLENVEFWKSIIDGIERGKVKLEAVPLGKNQDGTKKIILHDVWPDSNRNRVD